MFEPEVRCAGPHPRKAHAQCGDATARHVCYIPTAKNDGSDSEVHRAGVRLGFSAILEPYQRLACGRFSAIYGEIFAKGKLPHSTLTASLTSHQSKRPSAADEQPAPVILADNGITDGAASMAVVINITMAVGIYNH